MLGPCLGGVWVMFGGSLDRVCGIFGNRQGNAWVGSRGCLGSEWGMQGGVWSTVEAVSGDVYGLFGGRLASLSVELEECLSW